jgi:thiol-disulfide isomerase/thioredoxin
LNSYLPQPDRRRWLLAATGLLLAGCGEKRPDGAFQVETDDGLFDSAKHKGEVIYLDFWATWCPPCLQSFPWMSDMQRKYADKKLRVVAVSIDIEQQLISEFINRVETDFTIGYDPKGALANQFGVRAMPTAFVIDRKGRIASTHAGFSEDRKPEFEEKLVAVLDE